MWFLLSPGSAPDDGDVWALALLAGDRHDSKGKKMLERDDRWHFSHDSEIPQSACPIARASLKQKLGFV